jgi:hypothetical protein
MGMAKGDMAAKSDEVGAKHGRSYFWRATQKEQCKTWEEKWQNEDRISRATDNARLKGGGNPVSQHKIQMIGYFANLVGLGLNILATWLLMKYPPESNTAEGVMVTADFEKKFVPEFERFIKKAHYSIILLLIGFALQFLAAILL